MYFKVNPCFFNRLTLALNIAPLIRIELSEVVIKTAKAAISPNIAMVQPFMKSQGFHLALPIRINIQEIAARNIMLTAKVINQADQNFIHFCLIFTRRDQKIGSPQQG